MERFQIENNAVGVYLLKIISDKNKYTRKVLTK